MRGLQEPARWLAQVSKALLSVPVFIKILGIGVVVAVLFGGVTLVQTRASMSRTLYQLLDQTSRATATSLAARLERPMSTNDLFSVKQQLEEAPRIFPDIRYIIVWDRWGHVVASTFEGGAPEDLLRVYSRTAPGACRSRVLATEEGRVFDVVCPILRGLGGTLQLGIRDRMVAQELSGLTVSVLWTLAFCAAIGTGLALVLTHILTHPIHHLVQQTRRIREGHFDTRAEAFTSDEIGRLAVAFNEMAEGLQAYRREVQAQQQARLALIERIVQAQEEERKSVSRELHDQFGQSLLALLVRIRSGCQFRGANGGLCQEMEGTIQKLIDEVRGLARGLRPTILDDYGLELAVAHHIEEVSRHTGLKIDYQYTCPNGLGRPPGRIEVTLFRVAQEALTNVVRHAQATRASVVVIQQPREVTLLVEDNGRGFDPERVQQKGDAGLGLTGMRERVALLGGTFEVESELGSGTTIRVLIPLPEGEKCPSES